jgi:hypothetical protein
VLERLKRALIDTFVGAVGLGYLLALAIVAFINMFTAPIQFWAVRRYTAELIPGLAQRPAPSFHISDALPEVAEFLALALVWYLLFRWLYFKPFDRPASEASSVSSEI